MSVDYKGLLRGFLTTNEVVNMIQSVYGGENFDVRGGTDENHVVISFDETSGKERRMMHVFLNGTIACDYREVTSAPMTYVSLGRHGDCEKIVGAMVRATGGFILDEATTEQDWVEVTREGPVRVEPTLTRYLVKFIGTTDGGEYTLGLDAHSAVEAENKTRKMTSVFRIVETTAA